MPRLRLDSTATMYFALHRPAEARAELELALSRLRVLVSAGNKDAAVWLPPVFDVLRQISLGERVSEGALTTQEGAASATGVGSIP
jgi:hypothetical protein